MEDKKFILEFLEVYRSLPALWNVKSREYNNRHIKHAQYEVLLTKYKEKYPGATKKEVSQKINCLRTGYRRELKRINALKSSGSGLSEENDVTLYYFDALGFLRDSEVSCSSRSSMLVEHNTENEEKPRKNEEQPRKRKKPDLSDELITLAAKRLKEPKDELQALANIWANKLRSVDTDQRKFAEKFINDILFEADMGTLHRNAMALHINNRVSTPHSITYSDSGNSFRRSMNVQVPMVSGDCTSSNGISEDESGFTYVETPITSPRAPQPEAQHAISDRQPLNPYQKEEEIKVEVSEIMYLDCSSVASGCSEFEKKPLLNIESKGI